MNLIGTILLSIMSVPAALQDEPKKERSYPVTLEETECASTRRMRCSYHFEEVSSGRKERDKRHFDVLFYIGANQSEENEDAISRLDRFFSIKRELSSSPGVANTGTVGYKTPVTLKIQGSKYEFTRQDGQKIAVDIEKKTRP